MRPYQSGSFLFYDDGVSGDVRVVRMQLGPIIQQVEGWLRRQLSGRCIRLKLSHYKTAQGEERAVDHDLDSWEVGDGSAEEVESTLQAIASAAQRDCDTTYLTSQEYGLESYFLNRRYAATKLFTVSPTNVEMTISREALLDFVAELVRAQRIEECQKADPYQILGMRTEKT